MSLFLVFSIDRLLLQKTENVIEDKVTVGLLSKEERLREFAPRLAAVRHLTNDLDDDTTICRRLRIHGVNEDFTVLISDGEDLIVDFLKRSKTSLMGQELK